MENLIILISLILVALLHIWGGGVNEQGSQKKLKKIIVSSIQ